MRQHSLRLIKTAVLHYDLLKNMLAGRQVFDAETHIPELHIPL